MTRTRLREYDTEVGFIYGKVGGGRREVDDEERKGGERRRVRMTRGDDEE